MNNYEKIMLALFAIQHNAYSLHDANEALRKYCGGNDFTDKRCDARDKSMEEVISKLAEVMEILGECLNGMDAVSGIDTKLMKIPYDIVYGRKKPEDYE